MKNEMIVVFTTKNTRYGAEGNKILCYQNILENEGQRLQLVIQLDSAKSESISFSSDQITEEGSKSKQLPKEIPHEEE